jgi:uncharacterized protein YegJ (DUF2314 family)
MNTNKIFTGVLLCCILTGGTLAQSPVERAQKDQITLVPKEDPAMLAAFDKARASLDGFLAVLKAPAPNTDSYAVKVALKEGGTTEYFWINNLAREGERFSGTVNNTPYLVKRVKKGDTIRFARGEIYDWTYVDRANRRTIGNFTACALLTHEKPDAAADFKRHYGLQCD